VAELRAAVTKQLGFTCSGGIAQTKLLSKLGCGLHKPNQQTIILPDAVSLLFRDLPLDRLPGLGGDLGAQVKTTFNVSTASELAAIPLSRLESAFPKQAGFLLELAEGRYNDPVQDRELCKSLSNGKTFFGRLKLDTVSQCEHWLQELARELHQRYLEDSISHARAPTTISVSVGVGGSGGGTAGSAVSASRQGPISLGRQGTVQQIASAAHACFRRWLPVHGLGAGNPGLGVTSLGLSLSGMKPLENSSLRKSFGAISASAQPISKLGTDSMERPMLRDGSDQSPSLQKQAGPLARCFAATASLTTPSLEPSVPPPALDPEEASADVIAIMSQSDDDGNGDAKKDCAAIAHPGLDPGVLAELPADIRAEVLAGLQGSAPTQQETTFTSVGAKRPLPDVQSISAIEPKRQHRKKDACSGGTKLAAFFRPVTGGVAGA
jgi:hypothetical protein